MKEVDNEKQQQEVEMEVDETDDPEEWIDFDTLMNIKQAFMNWARSR